MAESLALWKKKYESGYREKVSELDSTGIFEPMLAKGYKDYMEDTFYPVFTQPKLDGIRVIAKPDGLFTRNGKKHLNLEHVRKDLESIFKKYPTLVIDGEGYADKLSNDFNQIVHLIKQQKPTEQDRRDSAKVIKYHVYDCYFSDQPDMPFDERNAKIKSILKDVKSVQLVDTYKVQTEAELNEYYSIFLEEGYEGQMIRTNTPYENKRTKALLKRKEFVDEEFKIVDVEEGVGNRAGTAGAIVLVNKQGSKFNSGIRGNKEFVTSLLKNKKKVVGKEATIRYQNLSPDGIPRFPVMIAIRSDYE
jgi:DNA ligase-1